jgi:hypothetical protein
LFNGGIAPLFRIEDGCLRIARAIPPRQDAEAIMLDFMQPAGTRRRNLRWRREARLDNSQPRPGTLTQRHAVLIGTDAKRVESVCPRTLGTIGGWGRSGGTGRPIWKTRRRRASFRQKSVCRRQRHSCSNGFKAGRFLCCNRDRRGRVVSWRSFIQPSILAHASLYWSSMTL